MHGGLLLASIAVPLIGFMSIWCALLLLKVPWSMDLNVLLIQGFATETNSWYHSKFPVLWDFFYGYSVATAHWLDKCFRAPYITQKLVEFHSECALICIRESHCVSKSWPVSFWMHKN